MYKLLKPSNHPPIQMQSDKIFFIHVIVFGLCSNLTESGDNNFTSIVVFTLGL